MATAAPVRSSAAPPFKRTTTLASLAGLLGLDLGSITGLIGLTCSPLDILGIGGNSCSQQPVCCSNNNFNGVIALGCNPINLNL
ncbi:fungal hydrophobin-domain-containing protein [Flammula alnicola]|nr:fungal hydrophobin-domain-containing protein [Flammula alnicola]